MSKEFTRSKRNASPENLANDIARQEKLIDRRRSKIENGQAEIQALAARLERIRERITKEYGDAKQNPDSVETKDRLSATLTEYAELQAKHANLLRAEDKFLTAIETFSRNLDDMEGEYGGILKN